jgi:hypothetical protein
MAKGRKSRRSRRQTYTYVGKRTKAEIREYSKFIPSLDKLKGKSRLTAAEKSQLTRAKKALQHTENLHAVTPRQAKQLRKQGLLDPIKSKSGKVIGYKRAVRLRNTSPDAKVRVLKSGIIVTSNGRKWEYHPVVAEPDSLISAGEELLDTPRVAQINLWTNRGRVNEGFRSKAAWAEYIRTRFTQYVQATEFTEGIAALIKEPQKGGT